MGREEASDEANQGKDTINWPGIPTPPPSEVTINMEWTSNATQNVVEYREKEIASMADVAPLYRTINI